MNNQQMLNMWPIPLTIGTKFLFLNSNDVEYIRLDCAKADEAIEAINKVCDLAKPIDNIVNRGYYDPDYVKTVLLSWSATAFRQMLLTNEMNMYMRDVYKLQTSEDSKNLDKKQKEGLRDLDLKFQSGKPYEQNELTYINNLVDLYIDLVEPILFDNPQEVIVKMRNIDKPERVALDKRIMLI